MNAVGDRSQNALARPLLRNAENPRQNTSRMPTIATNFQPRFLFMKIQSFVAGRQSLAKTTAVKIPAAPRAANDERPTTKISFLPPPSSP